MGKAKDFCRGLAESQEYRSLVSGERKDSEVLPTLVDRFILQTVAEIAHTSSVPITDQRKLVLSLISRPYREGIIEFMRALDNQMSRFVPVLYGQYQPLQFID